MQAHLVVQEFLRNVFLHQNTGHNWLLFSLATGINNSLWLNCIVFDLQTDFIIPQ